MQINGSFYIGPHPEKSSHNHILYLTHNPIIISVLYRSKVLIKIGLPPSHAYVYSIAVYSCKACEKVPLCQLLYNLQLYMYIYKTTASLPPSCVHNTYGIAQHVVFHVLWGAIRKHDPSLMSSDTRVKSMLCEIEE